MRLARQLAFAAPYVCACCGARGAEPCEDWCDLRDDDEDGIDCDEEG